MQGTLLLVCGVFYLFDFFRHVLSKSAHTVALFPSAVDSFISSREEDSAQLRAHEHFQLIQHDISTDSLRLRALIIEAFAKAPPSSSERVIDQIFNLACPASPPTYQAYPFLTMNTNFMGSINMLELAREFGATILQASTSEIYGEPQVHPQTEDYLGNVSTIGVRSCYDEGKRIAETLFMEYHRQYKTDVRLVRIFNTYGTGMHPFDGRVISNFIVQAISNIDITIYGDGQQTRSFMYIDDLVNGLISSMSSTTIGPQPVNLGNPHEFSILELAKLVLAYLPSSTSSIVFTPKVSDDPSRRKPDVSKAKSVLGWEPSVLLEEGLRRTIDYFSALNLNDYTKFPGKPSFIE